MNMPRIATTLSLVLIMGCAQARDENTQPASAGVQLQHRGDVESRNWLLRIRMAHVAAKSAAATGDAASQEHALTDLRALAHDPPKPVLDLAEASSVRHDLFGAAAAVALQLKRYDDARALIDEGLALPGHDPFRAQLFILSAEVSHALGDATAEASARALARTELQAQ